jgi:hypothetical protein
VIISSVKLSAIVNAYGKKKARIPLSAAWVYQNVQKLAVRVPKVV